MNCLFLLLLLSFCGNCGNSCNSNDNCCTNHCTNHCTNRSENHCDNYCDGDCDIERECNSGRGEREHEPRIFPPLQNVNCGCND